MKTAAIILAAGKGSRMQADIPKQYMTVRGKPLIYYALRTFQDSFIDEIILVVSPGDIAYCRGEIIEKYGFYKVKNIVEGGSQRYHSVCNGLHAVNPETDYVFIHDGARPCISDDILHRVYEEVLQYQACVVGMPVKDTIKIADTEGFAVQTPDRKSVWMIQTPQVFQYAMIRELYDRLILQENALLRQGVNITDDAMVVETFSDIKIRLVKGSYTNIKITTPEDIILAENFLIQESARRAGLKEKK
ncbi:MAG: 2-C-methyl-D-erythritol 4-phosphate cytidylyltransferase [Butyrivibrio sp.]|nr:2-C-methyl-D-erythritol 4-phosphate cytidylyltransferase [Butyrivibrio sp.]